MPKNFSLDIVTKHLFFLPQYFFSLQGAIFLTARKNSFAKKKVLSLIQGKKILA